MTVLLISILALVIAVTNAVCLVVRVRRTGWYTQCERCAVTAFPEHRCRVSPWVETSPEVQFGRPVVSGTRIPVCTIEANLKAGTATEVADWYGLSVEQVEGVRDYLTLG